MPLMFKEMDSRKQQDMKITTASELLNWPRNLTMAMSNVNVQYQDLEAQPTFCMLISDFSFRRLRQMDQIVLLEKC